MEECVHSTQITLFPAKVNSGTTPDQKTSDEVAHRTWIPLFPGNVNWGIIPEQKTG